MCQHRQNIPAEGGGGSGVTETAAGGEPFPWEACVFDAHCHPTDTMSSVASIAGMKARALTIMATRAQDQDLVASVAEQHGILSRQALARSQSSAPSSSAAGEQEHLRKVVPAFGWHPWFSYQLYDDLSLPGKDRTYDPQTEGNDAQKLKHYAAVLSAPPPDAHFLASLPEPKALSSLIAETRQRLQAHPLALVGEVGLDKAFRLPQAWNPKDQSARDESLTPGGREGRLLSPHHVRMPHQISVLRAQLQLAGELGRAVSVHGVQAHGVLFDAISALWKGQEKEVVSRRQQKQVAPGAEDFSSDEDEDEDKGEEGEHGQAKSIQTVAAKPFPPRICLHSFSGPAQMLKQWLHPAIPARVFVSFSVFVNLSTPATESKFPEVVRACPDDRILIESDTHIAGEGMDQLLEDMYRKVCEIKGWELREGVARIQRNYEEFIFG